MTTPSPAQGSPAPSNAAYGNPAYGSPTYDNPTGAPASAPLHPLVPVSIIATGVLLLAGVVMAFDLQLAEYHYRPWTWFYDAPGWLVSPLGFSGFGLALLFGALGGVPLRLFFGRATQHPGWAVLGPVGAVLSWPALFSLWMIHQWWETTRRFSGATSSFLDRMVKPSDLWAVLVLVAVTGVVATVARASRAS